MRTIINKKLYNTETAKVIGEYKNRLGEYDSQHFNEVMFITTKGNFFIYCSGGADSQYGIRNEKGMRDGEKIVPLSKGEAYQWLEDHGEANAIEEYFNDVIEEA